jgi:hypothetical protein
MGLANLGLLLSVQDEMNPSGDIDVVKRVMGRVEEDLDTSMTQMATVNFCVEGTPRTVALLTPVTERPSSQFCRLSNMSNIV